MSGQPQRALVVANVARLERARLHRVVAAMPTADGREAVADLLDKRTPAIQSMVVFDLLKWVRRNGDTAARHCMMAAGVSEFRRVRELTDRQILALEDLLLLQASGCRDRWAA